MNRTTDDGRAHDPELLAAYVENRLDDAERRAFTEHLAECPECRQGLALMARAGMGPVAAPRRRVSPPVWLAIAATAVLATVAVRRTGGPAPGDETAGPPPIQRMSPVPAASGPAPVATPAVTAPVADPLQDPGLLVKRGGGRKTIAGRTFHLSGGGWVDGDYDPTSSLPVVRVQGAAERDAIVARIPALAPYLALGDRVVVVMDGTVYRFAP